MAGSGHATTAQQPHRPYPGETLIPLGHEVTAHPIFFMLRRDPPSPPRLHKVETAASRSALLSLESSALLEAHQEGERVQASSRHQEDERVDIQCAICQKAEFSEPAAIIDRAAIEGKPVTTQCRHVYCYESCLKPWFQQNSKNTNLCPLCKAECTWLLISRGDKKFRLVAVGFDSGELETRPYPGKEVLSRARKRLESVKQHQRQTGDGAEEGGDAGKGEGGGGKRSSSRQVGKRRRRDVSAAVGATNTVPPPAAEQASKAPGSGREEEAKDEETSLDGTGRDWVASELERLNRQIERSKKKLKRLGDVQDGNP